MPVRGSFKKRFGRYSHFYLYGVTPAAEGTLALLQKLGKTVIGFIDRDPLKQAEPFLGYPVLAPDVFLKNGDEAAGIIIVSAYQMEIYRYLRAEGATTDRIFPHLDGMFFPTYGPGYRNNIGLDRVHKRLETDEEKAYFSSWRTFKVTGNYADLKPMASMKHQYEHAGWLSSIPVGGVCVDVGAYDGASSLDFMKTGLFKKVIALEPFEKNYQMLCEKLAETGMEGGVEPRPIALGAKRETIWQDSEDVSSRARLLAAGHIEAANDTCEKIEVHALDDLALDEVSALKVDIEGHELAFLEGARETLKRHLPHLAISAYHEKNHAADIIKFLDSEIGGVRVHVGHHPQAVYELEYYLSFIRRPEV